MVRKTRSLDDAHLNVFEAIKRAFIHRGFIPTRRRLKKAEELSSKTQRSVTEATTPNPEDAEKIEPAEDSEKLVDMTVNAHEVLLEVSTVFPFTNGTVYVAVINTGPTLTASITGLSPGVQYSFQVAAINSMPIKDVQSVAANVGPFFGSISIQRATMSPVPTPFNAKFLWRDDTLKIQRLLQGFILAHQKGVDCSAVEKDQLIILLNDLGQGVSD